MKRLLPIFLLGGGVALAVIIGQRMSTDAMAVVIGVAVGVAASVPTSLLLVALLRRERTLYRPDPTAQGYPPAVQQQPNVIVIDPTRLNQNGNGQFQMPLPPPDYGQEAGMRRITVVGDDTDW